MIHVRPLIAAGFFLTLSIFARGEPPCYVRLNQLGFEPDDFKSAVAFGPASIQGEFLVADAATGKTVWHGPVHPTVNTNWGQFHHHVECDFSALRQPGHYVLHITGANPALFQIQEHIDSPLADECLEFMREQRCGWNPFLSQSCHQHDGRTTGGPLPEGSPLDCTGGWHDAADMLKYLLTSGNATAQLLLAWQKGSSAKIFQDRVLANGQPGSNGVPDILDEARWGLEWMLKLHPATDQLYHQVADDRDHAGWRLPAADAVDYGWGASGGRVVYYATGRPQGLKKYQSASTGLANLAGRYAAAMAMAYQIFIDRDPDFAHRCLQAGREVYEMGRAHEGVQQGNSYGAPYRYAETTWADDMEWGAAALYAATHEAGYLTDAIHYAPLAGDESWMGKTQTGHYQYYPFVNLGHYALYPFANAELRATLAGYYRNGLMQCVAAARNNPYRCGVPFIWCSNNLLAALVTQGLLYEEMTGDRQFHAFICQQRDWLLGRNPWGTSMFTGIPADGIYPRHPHLMTVQLTGRPVRGALVDGPVYEKIFLSLHGVEADPHDAMAPFQSEQAVYHDDQRDYSSNEPTMDGTASAILMWALLSRHHR